MDTAIFNRIMTPATSPEPSEQAQVPPPIAATLRGRRELHRIFRVSLPALQAPIEVRG